MDGVPSETDRFGMLADVLGFHMQRLRAAMATRVVQALAPWGLPRGAYTLLALIARAPGLTQTMLAREAGIDKGQLATTLHALQSRDLIERRTRASDRRHNQLFLTELGQTTLDQMSDVVQEIEAPIRLALGGQGYAGLLTALERALAAIEAAPVPGSNLDTVDVADQPAGSAPSAAPARAASSR